MSDGSVRAIPVYKGGLYQPDTGFSWEDYKSMGGNIKNGVKLGAGEAVITDIVPGMQSRKQPEITDIPMPMPSASVLGIPRKTKYQLDQEALDAQPDIQKVDKVFRDPSVQFQLVPENDWSAVDAATMGMSTPDIIRLQQGGSVETTIDENYKPSGTDTGTGNRDAPAPVKRDRMANASEYDRMAAWAKANPALAAKVKPGQAGYEEIQKFLNPATDSDVSAFKDDSGYTEEESKAILGGGSVESVIDSSGISTTITSPHTTSNPESPQDGTSDVPDATDQSRAVEIPKKDPQEFLSKKIGNLTTIPPANLTDEYFEKLEAGELTDPSPFMKY